MTETAPHPGAPREILLATDLGARGDRALERAVAIARRYGAHLTVLHVVENAEAAAAPTIDTPAAPAGSGRAIDAVSVMKRSLRQGLREDLGDFLEQSSILVEDGIPAEVIERVASAAQVDLIITGISRESPLSGRPVVLGKTVETLLRRLPAPILIVRNRARDPYQHVVVATDFSETSGHALQMALRFFPEQKLHLLHASDLAPAAASEGSQGGSQDARAAELEKFLDSVFMPEGDRDRLLPIIEPGAPSQIIRDHVQQHGADLVVLGTRGRGAVLEALLGSTAKSILATLPCDALAVRGPPR